MLPRARFLFPFFFFFSAHLQKQTVQGQGDDLTHLLFPKTAARRASVPPWTPPIKVGSGS